MFVCKNVILVIIIVLQNPAGDPPGPPPTGGPVKKSVEKPAPRTGGHLDLEVSNASCTSIQA